MKFKIENRLKQNVYTILRQAGYMPIKDRLSGKESFVRKLTQNRYPRFHLYVSATSSQIIFDLHLDQTVSRYENQTAHNADYESLEVQQELVRIFNFAEKNLLPQK